MYNSRRKPSGAARAWSLEWNSRGVLWGLGVVFPRWGKTTFYDWHAV